MKLRHIVTERVNVNTPEFKRWFGKSKVVDDHGVPLVCYHGTNRDFKFSFRALTHFGVMKAANMFVGSAGGHIYSVYLKIENPLQIDDFDGFHDPHIFFILMRDSQFAPAELRDDASKRTQSYNDGNRGITTEEVVSFLKKHNFDGFVYINESEGRGQKSWVITDTAQVRSTVTF